MRSLKILIKTWPNYYIYYYNKLTITVLGNSKLYMIIYFTVSLTVTITVLCYYDWTVYCWLLTIYCAFLTPDLSFLHFTYLLPLPMLPTPISKPDMISKMLPHVQKVCCHEIHSFPAHKVVSIIVTAFHYPAQPPCLLIITSFHPRILVWCFLSLVTTANPLYLSHVNLLYTIHWCKPCVLT